MEASVDRFHSGPVATSHEFSQMRNPWLNWFSRTIRFALEPAGLCNRSCTLTLNVHWKVALKKHVLHSQVHILMQSISQIHLRSAQDLSAVKLRSIETPLPADPEGWIQIRFWNKFDTVSSRAIQQKQPDRKIFNLFTTLIAGPKEESR